MNKTRSDFLFATPSFASGAARLLDLYCLYDLYNSSSTEREADYKAMLSDWRVVGQDILAAMRQFDRSLPSGSRANSDDDLCGAERQMSLFR